MVKIKILNILASILLVTYPITLGAGAVYALPSLPGSPSQPSSPDSPDNPNRPKLPGENDGTGVNETSEAPTQTTSADPQASSSNTDTGTDSTNTSDSTVNNSTDTSVNNDAKIDNLVNADSKTGKNTSDKNSGAGSVQTGDASVIGDLESDANNIYIGSLECSTKCGVVDLGSLESGNSTTGSGSSNTSNSNLSNSDSLGIENSAYLDNYVAFDSDSGYNSASYNTGSGTVDSGDADVILTTVNTANNVDVGYEVFNVYDDQTGDLLVDFNKIALGLPYLYAGATSGNTTTGAGSTNTASSSTSNSNSTAVDNQGNVINNYYADANTGNNQADYNTGNGSVNTGDANVIFNLINFLNNVFLGGDSQLLLGVVNIFGSLSGDVVLSGLNNGSISPYSGALSSNNGTTGTDSDNLASSSLNNNTNIALSNDAQILNNVNLDANTGNNTTDKNTGPGSVSSGSSNTNLNLVTVANTSTIGSGGDVWMVLINNLGTWTGQLFGTNSSTGAYSPFFTFNINPDGSISASNSTTGANSTNNANTSVDNETNVVVNNSGYLVNNVVLDANTGNNSASKNTGSGSVQTGDANIAANIVNILNNTFIGGRFMLTIINVFGSFTGNVREGDASTINVGANDSAALSSSGASKSLNFPEGLGNSQLADISLAGYNLGSSNDGDNGKKTNLLLLANENTIKDAFAPISRFGNDRGLLDNFKLEFLIIPIIFGVIISFTKRAWLRR